MIVHFLFSVIVCKYVLLFPWFAIWSWTSIFNVLLHFCRDFPSIFDKHQMMYLIALPWKCCVVDKMAFMLNEKFREFRLWKMWERIPLKEICEHLCIVQRFESVLFHGTQKHTHTGAVCATQTMTTFSLCFASFRHYFRLTIHFGL